MDGSRSPPGLKPDRGQETDKKLRTELGDAARVMKAISQAFGPDRHKWLDDGTTIQALAKNGIKQYTGADI